MTTLRTQEPAKRAAQLVQRMQGPRFINSWGGPVPVGPTLAARCQAAHDAVVEVVEELVGEVQAK